MNHFKILPDDPRLTAYALGELEGAERLAFETALNADPAARAWVADIRATVSALENALETETYETVAVETVPADPYRTGGKSKLLQFPQVYYVVGGIAAACFAVLLALRTPRPIQQSHSKQSVPMTPPTSEVASAVTEPSVESPVASEAAILKTEAATGAFNVAGMGLLDQTKQKPELKVFAQSFPPPAPTLAYATAQSSATYGGVSAAGPAVEFGSHDNGTVVMAPFEISAPPAASRGYTGTLAGARVRTDPRDLGSTLGRISPEIIQASRAVRHTTNQSWGGMLHIPDQWGAVGTESYAYRPESDFIEARQQRLSTFSADVDTASYANIRRMLNEGQRPPIDAVRIEEMLNYFPYRYAAPRSDEPFAATMEVAEAPWAPDHRLVRIGLKARDVKTSERGAANLVFLLDVSGSMNAPNRLPLVKESMRLLVERLRPDDRVAIVVYAGASGLALPSTPAAQKREILSALEALSAEGSTNGAMGIHLAYDIAKANFVTGGINRVILCTDGDFNVGVTGEGELTRLIEEKTKSGVFLTVLGYGVGNLKDSRMQQLAERGNGNYGHVDSRREAEKLLVQQVNGTLVTIAKDVKLQVEFNPEKVASYRLIGYEKRALKNEDFANDKIDAGEIGAGHTVTALYEIIPAGFAGAIKPRGEEDELRYVAFGGASPTVRAPPPEVANELLTLRIRYKEAAGILSKKREFPLTDTGGTFAQASGDFKFAAAVASFGMLLRDSAHKGNANYASVQTWANGGLEDDAEGYRAEFVGLVQRVATLAQ